jgi:hypothetical protein
MNNLPDNIQTVFRTWGSNARKTPSANSTLRERVFAEVSINTNHPSHQMKKHIIGRVFPLGSIVFTSFAVIAFLVVALDVRLPSRGGIGMQTMSLDSATSDFPNLPYPGNEIGFSIQSPLQNGYTGNSLTDSREFLKTSYRSTMHTRHVEKRIMEIEGIVHSFDGRIDQISSSPNSGSISFAIPEDSLFEFRTLVGALVGEKFFDENVSSTNLLQQKVSIETEKASLDQTLATQQASRTALTTRHNQTIASINARGYAIVSELASIESKLTGDAEADAYLIASKNALTAEYAYIPTKIANENNSYKQQLAQIDASIASTKSRLEGNADKDEGFTATIETVNGSVSVLGMSLLGALWILVSPYGVPLVFLVIAVVWYAVQRFKRKLYQL